MAHCRSFMGGIAPELRAGTTGNKHTLASPGVCLMLSLVIITKVKYRANAAVE